MLLEVEDIDVLDCVVEDVYVDAPPGHLISLKEMHVCPAPNVFRVLARVVDFFPFDLKDACVLRHVKCRPM